MAAADLTSTSGDAVAARMLRLSVWGGVGFALLALTWGLAIGSQMIIFDGVYSLISVLLSLVSVLAFRVVRRGPDERYPFGREVFEPLAILFKAVAIGALCVYALTGAVTDLLAGGRETDAGWAAGYAALATLGCLAVTLVLRRSQRAGASDLVRAESAQWLMDTALSGAVLIGFLLALLLDARGQSALARLVDPAMVALVSVLFLGMPLRLVREGLPQVLGAAPETALRERAGAEVDAVQRRYRFDETFLRMTKVGGRLSVEIDFVVTDDSTAQHVSELDVVRRDLHEALAPLTRELWLTVSFTTDRRWAR